MRRELVSYLAMMMAALLLTPYAGADPETLPSVIESRSDPIIDGAESVRVGGIFSLTGDQSSLGVPAAEGATLAAKEINAAGGLLGRPLEIVLRDDEYKMDLIPEIARQLIEEEDVALGIGFTDSDSMLAGGPSFQSAGLPFVAVGATSPRTPQEVGDVVYLACFGDNTQAAAGAEYAAENFGRNAYLLWDESAEYTRLLAGYFKTSFIEYGGSILLEDSYDGDATDLSAEIDRLKMLSEQPDFYYIAAMPCNVGLVVEQFRSAGLKAPIVGGDGYDTPDIVTVAGNASDNVFFTTHALMDSQNGTEEIKRFIAAYSEEYGHSPENAFAALGYDSVYLVADAITRAGSTDPQAVQKALQETENFCGVTGNISYPDGAHIPLKDVTIVAIKGGKFTLGAVIAPERVAAP